MRINQLMRLSVVCGLACLQGCAGPDNADLASKLEALDARVANLEKQLGVQPQANPAPQSKNRPAGYMPAYMNGALWEQLSTGMSQDVVRGILGEPSSIQKSGGLNSGRDETWYYKHPKPDGIDGFAIFSEGVLTIWNSPGI